MKGWWVNDELERMWKETVVTQFKVLSRRFPVELRKTTKKSVKVAGLRAEIMA
jgi:hypothetical protein